MFCENIKNETVESLDDTYKEICFKKNKIIQNIIFKTYYGNLPNTVKIGKDLLSKWRNISEFLDILLNSYHDSDTYELDFTHIIDLHGLMEVFDFLNNNKIQKNNTRKNSEIIKCLAYLGIHSSILNDIKKGFGFVYELTELDINTKKNEETLKNTLNKKSLDNTLLLEQCNFDLIYKNYKNNYSNIRKKYGFVNTLNNTFIPENNLNFVKSIFINKTNNIFDNIPDILVAGGIISNIFTLNECYITSDYDVFLLTQDNNRALEIVNIIYEKMNTLKHTHILKTKNTITLYNTKYEIQIITKLYDSIFDVLNNFDLDSCCVGYSNGNLYALPRFIRSLAYCGNILNPEKYSSSYFYRLKKYMKRGFSVYIPGLDKKDINYNNENFIVKKLKEKNTESCSDYLDINIAFIKNKNYNDIIETLKIYHKRNKLLDIFDVPDIKLLANSSSKFSNDDKLNDTESLKNVNTLETNNVYIDWYNTEITKYIQNNDLYTDMYSCKYFY
jgi:hypothetical protein